MDRMKGISRCADCVYYSLQQHKCNICNSVESNPADSFFDDCPHPDAVPTRQQEWIPVSERLPKNCVAVNVVWINRKPAPYYASIKDVPFTATAVYFKNRWYWYSSTCEDILCEYGENKVDQIDKYIEITHWMPLPEPPKENVNGK